MVRSSSYKTSSDDDDFLRSQPEALRAEVADIWAMRAGLELAVSAGYSIIIRELFETGVERVVLELCSAAVRDEVGHAQLCLDLAERIDGRKRPWPAPTSLHVPIYDGVPPGPLQATLHLVAMSCLNETIACTRLLEAMQMTQSKSAKCALRTILTDEVQHARAGWAHLASNHVTPAIKREIAARIPELVAASLKSLIDENASITTEEFSAWGLPSVTVARGHAQQAIRDVVMPGFEHMDITVH
jgi:hypothetical protein